VIVLGLSALSAAAPVQDADRPLVPRVHRVYGAKEFHAIRSVAVERSGGGLWVASGAHDVPVRIARATGVITPIGTKGAGPREFQEVGAVVSGPRGQIGVHDPRMGVWHWVDSTGRFLRTLRALRGAYAITAFVDDRGQIVVGQPGSAHPGVTEPVRLALVSGTDSLAAVGSLGLPLRDQGVGIWQAQQRGATSGGRSSVQPLYRARVVWTVDTRGRTVSAWTDSSFVVVRDGTRDQRIALSRAPAAAVPKALLDHSKKLVDDFEMRASASGAEFVGARPAIPAVLPQVSGLLPDDRGGFAVVRAERTCEGFHTWRAAGSGAPAAKDQPFCPIVERIDAEGRLGRRFSLAVMERLVAIRGDTVWVVRTDADQLQTIVEYVVPRQ
jgi:hypothetical protein